MDVLGLPVEEARVRLRAAGVAEVGETITRPPRPGSRSYELRVVRQDVTAEGVVTLVTAGFQALPSDCPETLAPVE